MFFVSRKKFGISWHLLIVEFSSRLNHKKKIKNRLFSSFDLCCFEESIFEVLGFVQVPNEFQKFSEIVHISGFFEQNFVNCFSGLLFATGIVERYDKPNCLINDLGLLVERGSCL